MPDVKKYWLDRSENVTKLYRGLWGLAIFLLLFDVMLHKHEEVDFAAGFAFYAGFGFVACVALVLAAKEILRRLVKRPEDYYER